MFGYFVLVKVAAALNRLGLGARPDEPLPANASSWLVSQFDTYVERPAAWATTPKTGEVVLLYEAYRAASTPGGLEIKQASRNDLRLFGRRVIGEAMNARASACLESPAPFIEHLVHFWSNHFSVSADNLAVVPFVGAFEAEVIRPNVLGKFRHLLTAAEQHVAMLTFLNQSASIGPNSARGVRLARIAPQKRAGLNENLAREILELHTLGVRTGYVQEDVRELAGALTGWQTAGAGLGRSAPEPVGAFTFVADLHEPGTRRVLGRSYPQTGADQGLAILRDLSVAPATAKYIAFKLARHFVADAPPADLVDRMAAAFLASDGDLPTVYRILVQAPELDVAGVAKFKSPWEWLISALRAIGARSLDGLAVEQTMDRLGQPLWKPESPAGYGDLAETWTGPNALMLRVEMAQRLQGRLGREIDARQIAPKVLPGVLRSQTAFAIARTESPATGLVLLFVAPEFLRR